MSEIIQNTPATQPDTCQDCGKKNIKNMGNHRRYCLKRQSQAQKEAPDINQSPIENPLPPKEEPKQKPVYIVDVQEADWGDNVVAWFISETGDRHYKSIDWIGRLVDMDRGESIPCVLVLSFDGTVLPPFMLPGFIGIYSQYHEFPEPDKPDTTESFPPFEVDEEKPEPVRIKAPIEPDKAVKAEDNSQKVIIVPPNSPQSVEKQTFVDRIIHGRRKTAKTEQPSPPAESNDIFEKLKNATKT